MRVAVRVKPGSRKGPAVEPDGDGLVVFVRERAVDGAANDALVRVLADHFGTAPSRIRIMRGHTARIKLVEVES